MNKVLMIGRLTKDPEYKENGDMKMARFSIALDRGKDKDGKDLGADYPSVVAWGKRAETIKKYLGKGSRIGIEAHIHTGTYEKDGQKYYSTDFVIDRFEFLETKKQEEKPDEIDEALSMFSQITDEDIPF